jgi:hypothetical protein
VGGVGRRRNVFEGRKRGDLPRFRKKTAHYEFGFRKKTAQSVFYVRNDRKMGFKERFWWVVEGFVKNTLTMDLAFVKKPLKMIS